VVCVPLDARGQLPLPGAVLHLLGSSTPRLEGGKAVVRFLREGKCQVAMWQPGTLLPAAKADFGSTLSRRLRLISQLPKTTASTSATFFHADGTLAPSVSV